MMAGRNSRPSDHRSTDQVSWGTQGYHGPAPLPPGTLQNLQGALVEHQWPWFRLPGPLARRYPAGHQTWLGSLLSFLGVYRENHL